MKALLLSIFLLIAVLASGQTSCADGVRIIAVPFSTTGSTCKGAIATYIAPCALSGDGRAFYYTLSVEKDTCVRITIVKAPTNLRMYAAITEYCNLTKCLDANIEQRPDTITLAACLQKNVPYTIVIYSNQTASGGGENPYVVNNCIDFSLTIDPIPVAFTNDPCLSEHIDNIDFFDSSQTCEGNPVLKAYGCGFGKIPDGQDYIYDYTPKLGETCITVTAVGLNGRPFLGVFSGCPNTTNCIKVAYSTSSTQSIKMNVEPGKTYYFLVSANHIDNGECLDYTFELAATPSDIEDCPNAENVIGNTYISYFNFVCKEYPYPTIASCQTIIPHDAVFYKISSPGKQCLGIRLDNYLNPTNMFIFKGCPYQPGAECISSESRVYLNEPGDYYILFGNDYNPNNRKVEFILVNEDSSEAGCNNAKSFTSFPVDEAIRIGDCAAGIYFACSERSNGSQPSVTYSFTVPNSGCYEVSCNGVYGLEYVVLSDTCINNIPRCINAVNTQSGTNTMRAVLSAGKTYYITVAKGFQYRFMVEARIQINAVDSTGTSCTSCTQNTCSTCQYSNLESSYFTGWEGFTGNFSQPLLSPNGAYRGVNSAQQIAILSGNRLDYYGQFPVVNPYSGKYSLRLGDNAGGAKSATARYTLTVENDADIFTYYYAVVLEDPGHPAAEQPSFSILAYTNSGDTIYCGNYEVTAAAGIPGFQSKGSFRYKPWSAVSIPIRDYQGQKINIQFTIKDCARGDHIGYAYLDAECSKVGTIHSYNCDGVGGDLIGPVGFKSYRWNTGDTTKDLHYSTNGDYILTATTYTDCTIEFTSSITSITKPQINTDSETNCNDRSVILRADIPPTEFTSYGWQMKPDSVGIGEIAIKTFPNEGPFVANYVIKTEGCEFIYPVMDTIVNLPAVDLKNDTLCFGSSVNYKIGDTDPMVSVLWYDSSNVKSRDFSAPGTYSVHITKGKCQKDDTLFLALVVPQPLVLGQDIHSCEDTLVFIGIQNNPYDSIRWSNYSNSLMINPTVTGQYVLTAYTNKCPASDTVDVLIDTIPQFDLGPDLLLCSYALPLTIKTTIASPVTWQDQTRSLYYEAQGPGTYSAELYNGHCYFADTVTIGTKGAHFVRLPEDTTMCNQDIIVLNAETDATNPIYVWNPQNSGQTFVVNKAGLYTITINDGPCTATDSINITYVNRPNVNLAADIDTCANIRIRLDAAPYPESNYLWNTGETTQSIFPNQSGEFIVQISRASCIESDTIKITLRNPPILSLGPDFNLCANETALIDASINGATKYLWNNSMNTSDITIDRPGKYWVSVTVPPCIVRDTIQVIELSAPEIQLKDTSLCEFDSLLISSPCNTCSYNWSTGEITESIYAKPGNTYELFVVNVLGCKEQAKAEIVLETECPDIYVPNAFTIDNDDLNEFFTPISVEMFINVLEIYTRWGQLIAKIPGPNPSWDGNMEGKQCKTDVYEWRIVYTDPKGKMGSKVGHVTLLR